MSVLSWFFTVLFWFLKNDWLWALTRCLTVLLLIFVCLFLHTNLCSCIYLTALLFYRWWCQLINTTQVLQMGWGLLTKANLDFQSLPRPHRSVLIGWHVLAPLTDQPLSWVRNALWTIAPSAPLGKCYVDRGFWRLTKRGSPWYHWQLRVVNFSWSGHLNMSHRQALMHSCENCITILMMWVFGFVLVKSLKKCRWRGKFMIWLMSVVLYTVISIITFTVHITGVCGSSRDKEACLCSDTGSGLLLPTLCWAFKQCHHCSVSVCMVSTMVVSVCLWLQCFLWLRMYEWFSLVLC